VIFVWKRSTGLAAEFKELADLSYHFLDRIRFRGW
jgi:hypothetical protein